PTKARLALPPPHRLRRRMFFRRVEQCGLVMYECLAPPHTSCPTRTAPIDENAEQPGTESLGVLAAREGSVSASEGILQRLFRILPVAQHVNRIARVLVPVAGDERAVRVHLAVLHSSYERRIRAIHTAWTLHPHLPS